jgi:carboxymethylenebutenolidase
VCHQMDARPPRPPVAGGAGIGQERELVLRAQDGNRFAAHAVTSPAGGGPGVVILPDIRGLHRFYRELALRFAEAGIHACAMDYFGRTAGVGPRDEGFDSRSHVEKTHDDTIALDVGAAVAHLRSPEGGGASSVFTVGFCFGGRNSLNQAARGHSLDGVVGFYGRLVRRPGDVEETPVELADRYTCPVLGLFGGADRGIKHEDVEVFRATLDEVGVTNELVVYEGAPHSFFDRTQDQYREECDDAWRRVLGFIQENS